MECLNWLTISKGLDVYIAVSLLGKHQARHLQGHLKAASIQLIFLRQDLKIFSSFLRCGMEPLLEYNCTVSDFFLAPLRKFLFQSSFTYVVF